MSDYKVADLTLADFGRKEITLAQAEMPALMSLRHKYAAELPLEHAQDASTHDRLPRFRAGTRYPPAGRAAGENHAMGGAARRQSGDHPT